MHIEQGTKFLHVLCIFQEDFGDNFISYDGGKRQGTLVLNGHSAKPAMLQKLGSSLGSSLRVHVSCFTLEP